MEESNITRFSRLIRYIRTIATIVGVDIFNTNYKISAVTYLTGIFPITISIAFIYMICSQIITLSLVLEGAIMMSLVIQGTTKLMLAAFNPKSYYSLYEKMHKLYTNDVKFGKNTKTLTFCVQTSIVFFKLLFFVYLCVLVGYACIPIFSLIFYNKKLLLFPVHLPFTDPISTFGFIFNISHQIMFLAIGVFGVLCYDIYFLVVVIHSMAAVNVFKIMLDKLDENILAKQNYQDQLKAAIINHNSLIAYFQNINETYTVMALVQITTSGLYISIAVFLWLWKAWIVSPFLIIAGIFQLFEFCILGTITQIENEVTMVNIYEILWYLMKSKDQSTVLLMLLRSQSSMELNAGKFAKLNVETGMKIMKMIYTFAMMINEIIN